MQERSCSPERARPRAHANVHHGYTDEEEPFIFGSICEPIRKSNRENEILKSDAFTCTTYQHEFFIRPEPLYYLRVFSQALNKSPYISLHTSRRRDVFINNPLERTDKEPHSIWPQHRGNSAYLQTTLTGKVRMGWE